jgi:hypothetical protein
MGVGWSPSLLQEGQSTKVIDPARRSHNVYRLQLQSETFTPPSDEVLEDFQELISTDMSPHGAGGPIGSSFSNYQYPVIRRLTRRVYPTSTSACSELNGMWF